MSYHNRYYQIRTLIKQPKRKLITQFFIEEIKDQLRQSENKDQRLKDIIHIIQGKYNEQKHYYLYLKQQASFQSEKHYNGVNYSSQSNKGGQLDSAPSNSSRLKHQQQNILQLIALNNKINSRMELLTKIKTLELIQCYMKITISDYSTNEIQFRNDQQIEVEVKDEGQEEINNYIYFIFIDIVVIIAVQII
ncbi:unnamed protein product [Paramecium octaurelia]|uniref:Transmembrane protein n=1 Tax=Paramecium octaurelia TaxID=43137 RepID=A0A8S1ST74_PAROT|nr:unnamed protein product [Paramecium octaurelia]